MKSRKMLNKISAVALAGLMVAAPSASLYAKTPVKVTIKKWCIQKPNCGQNAGSSNGTTGNGSNNGTTNKPGSGSNNGATNKPSSPNGGQTGTTAQKSFEDKVLELVNVERAKNGLSALQMDESVRKVARVKSSDMSKNKYFSHTSPTYGTPFEMLKSFGISYRAAGENIAQGYTTPEAVVKGWMNSAGHRANILNSKYTHIGVGYEASGNYWTQLFIGK